MGFQEAITTCFSKYVGFQGRAVRSEYWYWVLFIIIVTVVIQILAGIIGSLFAVIGGLFSLGTLLPSIAVGVRRLHDLDKSGWWLLLAFIPVIGGLVLLYFLVQPGTPGPNRFDERAAYA